MNNRDLKTFTTSLATTESGLLSLDPSDMVTLKESILQHHKVTAWHASPDQKGVDENVVNAIRVSDWADVTIGALRYGLPASCLEAAFNAIPEAGFHLTLAGMGQRLRPNSFLGGRLAIPDILRW